MYDADGRPLQTVTYREPEFSEDDLALLLEYAAMERDKGPHGHPMSEATSTDMDRRNRNGKGFYTARLITDFAEEAKRDAEEGLKASGGSVPNGAIWIVDKVERA